MHTVGSSVWLGMLITLGIGDVAELHHHGTDGMLDGLAGALIAWVLVPAVALVLCTGLLLAARSSWGLVRHWWMLGKLIIAAALTVYGLAAMLNAVHAPHDRLAAAGALGAAIVLSVVKPWGRTPFAPLRHRRAIPG